VDKRASDRRSRRQAGFTLTELLVTVTIAVLLAALATPAFQQLVASQRMRTASYDMVSDLVLARSEALKRGGTVQVVPAGTGWVGGWTVRLPGLATLSQRNAVGRGITVTSTAADVSFDMNGRVVNDGSTVRFTLEEVGGARKRCVSLDPSGRPRSSTSGCPT
jgi:type IV fimbrial biogenesis protein FimT